MQYFENDPPNVLTLVVDFFWIEIFFKKMVQHICTILTFQNVTKAVFWFTNYKSDIFHFASFSRCCSPRFVFMLSHSVVSPQGGDPNATSRCESFAPMRARARWGKTKASSVFTASCAIYVKKKWGIDGSAPFKTGQLSHLCP